MRNIRFSLSLIVLLASFSSFALQQKVPSCKANGREIGINNAQVINWKQSTPNLFEARARVKGELTRMYPDRNGHYHFQIQIGPNAHDTLEVVYNKSFGDMSGLEIGQTIEACGDYITSNKAARYPASPDGAIIHWVHLATRGNHESGYVIIGSSVCGQLKRC